MTTGGFVSSTTLAWLAQRADLPFDFTDHQLSNSLDEMRQGIRDAVFVIEPEDHTAGVFLELPSWAIHAQVAQVLNEEVAAGRLRLLRSYPTQDGGAYQLFVNDEKTSEWTDHYSPVLGWDGFLPWEGPYPESHLGRVRWGIGQHERVEFAPDTPGRALLTFSVRADQPVHGTVAVNGAAVAAVDLPGRTGFHSFHIPINRTADATVMTLDFDRPLATSPDGFQRALLFRELEMEPAP